MRSEHSLLEKVRANGTGVGHHARLRRSLPLAAALITFALACAQVPRPPAGAELHDASTAAAGPASFDASARGNPSECIAEPELPASCTEVCNAQGKPCALDCDFGSFLEARAAYYPDVATCERGGPAQLVESASCDAPFSARSFSKFGAVRCCCGATDFEGINPAQRQALCDEACSKDPYRPIPECADQEDCQDICRYETRSADLACAECITAGVSFKQSLCGSRECWCGGAGFPDAWDGCYAACGAARQNERDLYEAVPRPEPSGRRPILQVAPLEAFRIFGDVHVDEFGYVWATSTGRIEVAPSTAGGTVTSVFAPLSVSRFDPDLRLLWRWDDAASREPAGAGSFVRSGYGITVTVPLQAGGSAIYAFDADGLVGEATSELKFEGSAAQLGAALLAKHRRSSSTLLSALDATGALLYDLPPSLFERWPPAGPVGGWAYGVDTETTWHLVGPVAGGIDWQQLEVTDAMTRQVASTVLPAPAGLEDGEFRLRGAETTLAGERLVWGSVMHNRGRIPGQFPYAAAIGTDGTAAWQWSNAGLPTLGDVRHAVQLAGPVTCLLGEESWEYAAPASASAQKPSAPRCTPEGCSSLALRCLSAQGEELWHYHHRSERSYGVALAAGPTGALYVAMMVQRDARLSTGLTSLLLKFEP